MALPVKGNDAGLHRLSSVGHVRVMSCVPNNPKIR